MKQLITFFIFVTIISCASKDPMKQAMEQALELKPIPSFKILLSDSTNWVSTTDVSTNKSVVMFFFSPHCPYCRAQMDDIMKNMRQLKDIQFYLVTDFPVQDIKEFYSNYKLADYPNIIVGKDTANYGGKYFKIPGVPFTAVFGKDKKPNKFFLGKTNISAIRKAAED
ncbi:MULTISPECIES: TlpA family protein disulfide reductase [Niastella]|uniref:Redoxin domain-containing protein n=1 Tax=Niastella soli TaxID=2821487 RepID=A0ABS3YUF4_9BACT|nr:redoxin domain-containing protein [Niastella soli]MBO9201403.1 redoxin domain-containing protein [Niastella soli]